MVYLTSNPMEEAFIIAQTLFYFVASFAIIVIGLIFCAITYYTVQIGKRLRKISENVEQSSAEVRENIREFFERLADISFASLFFGKGRRKKHTDDEKS